MAYLKFRVFGLIQETEVHLVLLHYYSIEVEVSFADIIK